MNYKQYLKVFAISSVIYFPIGILLYLLSYAFNIDLKTLQEIGIFLGLILGLSYGAYFITLSIIKSNIAPIWFRIVFIAFASPIIASLGSLVGYIIIPHLSIWIYIGIVAMVTYHFEQKN